MSMRGARYRGSERAGRVGRYRGSERAGRVGREVQGVRVYKPCKSHKK